MARSVVAFLATCLVLIVGCGSTEKEPETPLVGPASHPGADVREEHSTGQEVVVREEPRYEEPVTVVRETPRSDGLHWTERAYPTGDRRTSTILLESGTPGEVSVGVPYEYVLKVTNISNMNLENVVVLDKPRGNFELRGSDPKTANGRDLRWEIGSLRPNQAKEIRVSGSAVGEGQVVHCAEVDWRSIFCSTTQVVKPGLTIQKTATAAVLVCDPITYAITVSNNGSGVTRNVVIEDRLPNGLQTLDGKTSVQYSLASLAPGESKTFTHKVKATRSGRFAGGALARADGNLSANAGEVATTVTKPVLVIEKRGTRQTYMGRDITYDMVLRNTGDGEARDVVVNDSLPSAAKFLGASDGGTVSGNVVSWRFGTMAPGASKTFSMKASSVGAAKIRSTATASAYCADAVTAMVETDVTGIPAILLEVLDANDPVEIGGTTTYVITATNQGSVADTNIRIVVSLEDTMGFVSASGDTKADETGQKVTFRPVASLAPGDKVTWRVEVKAIREGDVRINVKMTSDQLTRSVDESEATRFFK